MTVATPADVAVAIGRSLSTSEDAQVQYWLDGIEIVIGSRLGDVTLLDQAVLKFVETEAAALKLSNPNGFQSESIDDYTYRFGAETRRITILDEWWDLLTPAVSSNAFTVTPYGAPDPVDDDFGWVTPTEQAP